MGIVKKNNTFKLFFITFLTSFLLGVIFAFNIANYTRLSLLKTGPEGSFIEKTGLKEKFQQSISLENNLDLSKFWEVYNTIMKYNYDVSEIEKDKLINGAIKGMVEGLGDKHSEYMTLEESNKFNEVLSGDFEGIGAVVEKNELGVIIERVIKGSPAKKYGLQSGDILIKANENELTGLDLYDAVDFIKGAAGTHVILKVLRKGEKDILTIDVVREKIKIPSIDYEKIEGTNLGYISINMFGDDTSRQFEKAIEELKDTDGMIIDLRDNGGGYLQSSVEILSNLIEDGKVIVTTKYKDHFSNIVYKSVNFNEIYDKKMVVLINENSASASEITAGALKDYKKAILVGKKSYGKGSVQKPFDITGGSLLKMTIAKWFTPLNKNIDGEGIEPDIFVDFEKEDFENQYDRQKEKAQEVLQEFIKNGSHKKTIEKYDSQEKDIENNS